MTFLVMLVVIKVPPTHDKPYSKVMGAPPASGENTSLNPSNYSSQLFDAIN